ncbi:MAG: hypothetical protein KatS3mg003_2114 [Candidatus Nitrosocaldaceae archaeon]|nr:MAG: hypothetical protein KatS3mg003_2045 [Candidatus Nitrosocaldaceae archaeon]GIU72635.1 MAG: hypothetical protein KatS3mg003_2114 [Candidatus Nitrosocaldaceae archaeon]
MRVEKKKAKHVSIIFFGVGAWGTAMSLFLNNSFLLFLAGINIALGVLFVFLYKKPEDKRSRR